MHRWLPTDEKARPMSADKLMSRLMTWLRLVRLPNVFTAVADVTMGLLIVEADRLPAAVPVIGLLIGCSALLYIAGVVLNDYFDRHLDAQQRPERPLPSGKISPAAAAVVGWAALLGGVLLACCAAVAAGQGRPAVTALLLASAIVAYNRHLKATFAGPVVMGLCRGLNALLGMSVADGPLADEHLLIAAALATYIAGVSWLARNETGPASRTHLAMAMLVMLSGVGLLAWVLQLSDQPNPLLVAQPQRWQLLVAVLAVLIGWRTLWAVVEATTVRIRRAVSQAIVSLVVLDAAACFALRDLRCAMFVLLLLLPVLVLQQLIDMT